MVRTRAQENKLNKMKRSRARRSKKPDGNAPLEEASSSGDRKKSTSSTADSSGGRKGVNRSYDIQQTSKSRTFRASQSHFLNSSSEEGKLLDGRSLLSNLAKFSSGRLSDSLQLASINGTHVLHDVSSALTGSSIKMDFSSIQQLSSIQASADKLDVPPNIFECSVNLTDINMTKAFHKYLDETVTASIPKASSEQDTLEERSHNSTSESQPVSTPPSKRGDKRRQKEKHENQELFQEVLDNDSKQHESTGSLPSQEADDSQNSTVNTPTVTQPFGKKRNRSLVEVEYENVLEHTSPMSSPRKCSSRHGGDISQQSIAMTPQAVQPFGKRQRRIESEASFGDVLTQPSPRSSLKKSICRIEEVSHQSIPSSPQGPQPFGKRGKKLQNEDNFEVLKQLSPRLTNSKAGEVSESSISKSPQAVRPFGKRQKRLQNEDNFEDTLRQLSPRTSLRELDSSTGEVSEKSVSRSLQMVKPFSKPHKSLQTKDDFEDILSQSSPRTSPRKFNSKTSDISESSISKSPQAAKPFGKRQKRLQNGNFEEIVAQSSPGLSPKKLSSKTGKVSESSISKSPQTVKPFGKREKKLQYEDNFEDTVSQLSPRRSPRKLIAKTGKVSDQLSPRKSPRKLNAKTGKVSDSWVEDNFEDSVNQLSPRRSPRKLIAQTGKVLDQLSPRSSPRKLNAKTGKVSDSSIEDRVSQLSPRKPDAKTSKVSESIISKSSQAVKPFGKREKRLQNEENFEDALSQSSLRRSPRKLNVKIAQVSESGISESSPVVQPFDKRRKRLQNDFEDIVGQLSPSLSPKKLNLKVSDVSQKDISKSPQAIKPIGRIQNRNENNSEDRISQLSPRASLRKLTATTGEALESSISKLPQALQPFSKRQKRLQREDTFEDVLAHSSPRTSPRKPNSKTSDISESSISKSPQAVKPFGKRQRRSQNGNFEEIVAQSSPGLSPKKINCKTGEVSQSNISKSLQAIKPFGERRKSLQNEDNFEDPVSQLSSTTSPRKFNSNTDEFSRNSISESLRTVQSHSKSQKALQNEDTLEDTLHHSVQLSPSKSAVTTEEVLWQGSSPKLSPRKSNSIVGEISRNSISAPPPTVKLFSETQHTMQNKDNSADSVVQPNSKTDKVSQSNISESPQTVQPFGERQKRIQSEVNFEDVLSRSSPRKFSSKTGGLALNNISESSPANQSYSHTQNMIPNMSQSSVTKLYGKTEDRIQNEDNLENTVSQSSTVLQASQSSIFKLPPAFQQSEKRQKKTQNENNLEQELSQSPPIQSPRKSSSRLKGNFDSSPVLKPSVSRERRAQENAEYEDILDIGTPRQSASKYAPNCIENRSDVSLVAASEGMVQHDKRQNVNKGQSFENGLELSSFKLPPRSKTNKESVANENKELYIDHSYKIGLSSKSAQHITPQDDDNSPDNTFESSKYKQAFRQRNINLNETSSSNDVEHTSLKEISRDDKMRSDKNISMINAVSSRRLNLTKAWLASIATHRTSTENLLDSGPELQKSASSHSKQRKTVEKCIATPVHRNISYSDSLQSKESLKMNKERNTSSKNHVDMEINSLEKKEIAMVFHETLERYVTPKNISNVPPLLTSDESLKENTDSEKQSETHHVNLNASSAYPAAVLREDSERLSEKLRTQWRQKQIDPDVLANEEAPQAASVSPQESVIETITSEQHVDTLSANQNQLSSSETVKTKDNSMQNPQSLSNQVSLADKHLIPSCELNSPITKLHNLNSQKGTNQVLPQHSLTVKETTYATTREHTLQTSSAKSHEPKSQKCNIAHSDIHRTELIEMVRKDGLEQSKKGPEPLSASHMLQNSSWTSFDSAGMNTSASSRKSSIDGSLPLRLKAKRKRFRKLSQSKRFDGETSDSSSMSRNVGVVRPRFVRKRKQSPNSNNDSILTKNITNTEPRAVAHHMASVGSYMPPPEVEHEAKNIAGLVAADSNMTEHLNTGNVTHTRIEDEHRKKREHQQSSAKKMNYTELSNYTLKTASKAKTGSGLFKSWLERRSYGQKKQKKLENHDKQLKIPFYHRPCTRVNEPNNLHVILKHIAEGNAHQNERLVNKSTVHSIAEAKEQIVGKKVRKANPALMVNGKVYRAPRLARPKQWVNKRLYDHIMPSIIAKYGEANSRIKAEEYVKYLCDQVSMVIRRKNYNNYRSNLEKIKKSLYNLGLIKCYNDYFIFIEKYLPFEFRYKAIPCLRAFGKHTGPPWSKDINIFADLEY